MTINNQLKLVPLSKCQLEEYMSGYITIDDQKHTMELNEMLKSSLRIKLQKLSETSDYKWLTYWAILLDKQVIGTIGFKGLIDHVAEVGYGIFKDFEGHGYMTEALRLLINWAKEQKTCFMITAKTALLDSLGSQRVLEKNGFRMVHTDNYLNYELPLRPRRYHILGASGSGTTTLAKALSEALEIQFLDTDDFFWIPTDPPYIEKRPSEQRISLLEKEFSQYNSWVLSGSLCGWGDVLIPYFDVFIYLYLPHEIRMDRLLIREHERHGDRIQPGGCLYDSHLEFIEWARKYDTADANMRSLKLHNEWLSKLPNKVIRLEGVIEVDEKIKMIMNEIEDMYEKNTNN